MLSAVSKSLTSVSIVNSFVMVVFLAAGTFERITAPCLLTFEREMTVWVLAFQVIF